MKENIKQRIFGTTREEEEENLREIIGIAQNNLDRAKKEIKKINEDLSDLMEVYEAQEQEGLSLWNNAAARLKENEHELVRLKKARKKPYFGRIDFTDQNTGMESYYIGRIGIAENTDTPVVLDWRAPIASVYYEGNLGPCQYTVSTEGTFTIDLKRKRTYEIENDRLKDFFDSDVVANDELLTKYLAKNKKAVLGEIIATIQKEQNLMIRRSPKTNLIVQGVAGSGKTTVAMHRISYILYNYKEEFRPEDFYIIGSNQILLNYITGVLPELDVYGIRQMTMEQLFIRLLYEDWDEKKYSCHPLDSTDESSKKGSLEWFEDLKRFCEAYEQAFIPHEEIFLEKTGILLMGPTLIDTYLKEHPLFSMQSKILMLNEILYGKFENEVLGKEVTFSEKEKKALEKKYKKYFGDGKWEMSIYDFYNAFLQAQAAAWKAVKSPENSFDVYDLAALAYVYKRMKEIDPVREASHVVIDEAQDFGMMAYECLFYCLRGCTYTIMGDTSQNIHFASGLNDWDQLRNLILTGAYDAFGLLRKSYRNTVEISEYANEILRHGSFAIYPVEPILRHGEAVRVEQKTDVDALLYACVQTIQKWQKQEYGTIAVICRDEEEVSFVMEQLGRQMDVADLHKQTAEFGDGVMVLSVEDTKGLEFDAVLLYNPMDAQYPWDDGHVKLLYVAATRALHELTILYYGTLSRILSEPVPKENLQKKQMTETLVHAPEFKRQKPTQKQVEQERRVTGEKERAARGYIGPKQIEVLKQDAEVLKSKPLLPIEKTTKYRREPETKVNVKNENHVLRKKSVFEQEQPVHEVMRTSKQPAIQAVNLSSHAFGEIPENRLLPVPGHTAPELLIREVKKTKTAIEFYSAYGTLRLTPITPEIIRVNFVKGKHTDIRDSYWKTKATKPVIWSAKKSRTAYQVATEKLHVVIDQQSGAMHFLTADKTSLLKERTRQPRLILKDQTWNFFEWDEKINAKGVLATDLLVLRSKAKYISFGGKAMRMPLVLSSRGYGIGVAATSTVLLCNITTYGQYIHTEDEGQIDYYFIYGGDNERTISLYKQLVK